MSDFVLHLVSLRSKYHCQSQNWEFYYYLEIRHIWDKLYCKPCAKMGPLSSLTGSELCCLAFLWLHSTFSNQYFQLQKALPFHKQESISHKQHNQLLRKSLEKCQHKSPTQSFDIALKTVDLVENSRLSWTNSVSAIRFCCSRLYSDVG